MRDTLRQQLRARQFAAVKETLDPLHWSEAAELLGELTPSERAVAFRLLSKGQAIQVFEELEPEEQQSLVDALSSAETVEIIEGMDPDDRVRFFDELPATVAKRLLASLTPETRAGLMTLLNYPEDSAGHIMNPSFVSIRRSATARDALNAIRRSPLEDESISTVFVIDETRRYEGFVRLNRLVKAAPATPVSELLEGQDIVVRVDDAKAAAARLLQTRALQTVPVVDREHRLVGAITFDDAMDALEETTSEMMYGLAGLAEGVPATEISRSERLTRGGLWYPVRARLLFLLIPLAGGFLVGGVIEQFEEVLAAVVATAIFIPVIMDTGGNVGTQSTTIFARGLALGHIEVGRNFLRYLWREARVGMILGAILGTLGGTFAFFWQGAPNDIPELGLAVGLSLFVACTLACILGFLLPWLLVKVGLDHAPGANPFITTIKDFTSLVVYFSLVSWLIGVA